MSVGFINVPIIQSVKYYLTFVQRTIKKVNPFMLSF